MRIGVLSTGMQRPIWIDHVTAEVVLREHKASATTKTTWLMYLTLPQVDVDLKVDLSRPNAMLFKVCSKCNARVLKKVLDVHERFCYGAAET